MDFFQDFSGRKIKKGTTGRFDSFKIFSGRKIKKGTTGRFDCSVVNIPSFS